MSRFVPVFAALLLLGSLAPTLPAQEEPLTAGSGGVPVPKRAKTVPPEYPAEAQAQGIRGIVILELVIDKEGKVVEARTVRSVPGLDEAALTAARQWTYEVTKVEGKPVSVRLTVPITFAMKLPDITRQEGIPELRQGVVPPFPPDAKGPSTVVATVTLDGEGRVAEAQVVQGDSPWTNALMAALRTWRFATESADVTLSFRVQADFIPGEKKGGRVALRLDGVHRSESLVGNAPQTDAPGAPAAPAPADPSPSAPPAQAALPASVPAPTPPSATPPSAPVSSAGTPPMAAPTASAPAPSTPAKPATDPTKPASPPAPSPTTPGTSSAAPPTPNATPASPPAAPARPSAPAASSPAPPSQGPASPPPAVAAASGSPAQAETPPSTRAAPPPVEVITAPPPPATAAAAPEPENGTSALRDVVLEAGVPDLAKGRRPMPPPFARMSATSGSVEVQFSVSAGGTCMVQSTSGPDLLKAAAEQTVTSWQFRRTQAQRLFLTALFKFDVDKATAVVRSQTQPPPTQP